MSVALCAAAIVAGCSGAHSQLGIPSSAAEAAPAKNSVSGVERVLYAFTGYNDGGNAATAIVVDGNGDLYGTTVVGGTSACGTVFELAPQPSPPWHESVLYDFGCFADGKNPHGGVAFDPHGNLDGTTVSGGSGGACGSYGCGVVFQLASSSESVLHSFSGGNDGFGPGSPVVFDSCGNLFGTTPDGGKGAQGVIYELSPHGVGWKERILHAFTGGDDGGTGSLGSLLRDASGNLYGVTETGGAHSDGTVFMLSPRAKKAKLTTLYAFEGTPDAASPYGGLIADTSGNLYGTTYYGGANGLGTVFELVKRGGNVYRERVLYSFRGGNDGSSSTSTLVFGAPRHLYGTTSAGGGSCDCGTIFELETKSGKEKVLHVFGASGDGAYPYYGLTKDSSGNFYGTTVAGGRSNQGTVFEFTP
jgi:uncharacterized repeat protein (TIGR03803 family)